MHASIPLFDHIQLRVDGAIGHMRLHRPEVLNAFNKGLMQDVLDAADWFNRRPDVKVVVVSAEGRAFCSGFDLDFFASEASAEEVRDIVALGSELHRGVASMRATTVAAVHGYCVGGGVVLMMACDFRYASEDAVFFLPETELGIPLAWCGIPGLVREMGGLAATEFVLLCEKWSAARALSAGMVNELAADRAQLDEQAARVARTLSERSSLVLESTKRQVIAARELMLSGAYGFTDAHLLHSALLDPESQAARARYLSRRLGRTG